MSFPVSNSPGVGPAAYLNKANRAAWRDDMLNQALTKVRQVQADLEPAAKPFQPAHKGRLIDVMV